MRKSLLALCGIIAAFTDCRNPDRNQNTPLQADYEKGDALIGVKNDSAFFYFNRALSTAKDSLETAMDYSGMAIVQSDAGDYFGSQESLTTALRYLDENNPDHHYCLLSIYNELGITSMNLEHFAAAADYYDQAIRFLKDDKFKPIALNNRALALQKNGNYAAAIPIYSMLLPQTAGEKREYARILSNLAKTRWQQNKAYPAASDMHTALQLREEEKDNWGRNASYAHLSDYYAGTQADSALFYARKMYAVATGLNSPDDQLEALEKLIQLAPPEESKAYFKTYHELSDSIQSARNTAKNQFALIRYGVEKSKADNLALKNENTEKQLVLYLLILFFVAVAVVAWLWQRKRDQQQKLKARNDLQALQLSTSEKLHDTIANGLYRLMAGIEHSDTPPKEAILDQLETLYEQSRNMSYDNISTQPFDKAVTALMNQFDSPATKVSVVGNHAALWETVTIQQKRELELILQELLINMKKHAAAHYVVFKFERNDNRLHIHYTDDGVGFPAGLPFGNGLTHTGNRISALGGSISFDRSPAKGVKIHLQIPIASA